MRQDMRTIIITFCALLLVAIPVGAKGQSCDPILSNIDNWQFGTKDGGLANVNVLQKVKKGEARMSIFAASGHGLGCYQFPGNRLICKDDAGEDCLDVTSIEADVRVRNYLVTDCSDNCCEPNFSRVRIMLNAFKADIIGDVPDVGPVDVIGSIRIWSRVACGEPSSGELQFLAKLEHCIDASCIGDTQTVGWVPLGPAPLKEWTTLAVEWDQIGGQFVYRADNAGTRISIPTTLGPPQQPPNWPHITSIRVDGGLVNCDSNREVIRMDASVKDVCVTTD